MIHFDFTIKKRECKCVSKQDFLHCFCFESLSGGLVCLKKIYIAARPGFFPAHSRRFGGRQQRRRRSAAAAISRRAVGNSNGQWQRSAAAVSGDVQRRH